MSTQSKMAAGQNMSKLQNVVYWTNLNAVYYYYFFFLQSELFGPSARDRARWGVYSEDVGRMF